MGRGIVALDVELLALVERLFLQLLQRKIPILSHLLLLGRFWFPSASAASDLTFMFCACAARVICRGSLEWCQQLLHLLRILAS